VGQTLSEKTLVRVRHKSCLAGDWHGVHRVCSMGSRVLEKERRVGHLVLQLWHKTMGFLRLAGLLSVVLVCAADFDSQYDDMAGPANAHLVARKRVVEAQVVAGQNMTVSTSRQQLCTRTPRGLLNLTRGGVAGGRAGLHRDLQHGRGGSPGRQGERSHRPGHTRAIRDCARVHRGASMQSNRVEALRGGVFTRGCGCARVDTNRLATACTQRHPQSVPSCR
jgi:hypothetical protein